MNLIELQDDLKALPDDAVRNMVLNPPQPLMATVALGELQRRQTMRSEHQARAASPRSTVADQLTAAPPASPPMAGGAGPQSQLQAPAPATPAIGMNEGGSTLELAQLINALKAGREGLSGAFDSDLRVSGLETIPGAMEQASALMGADPSQGLRALLEQQERGRRGRLLASIGTGMMTSNSPHFLSGVGAGLQAGVTQDRDDQRQSVQNQLALAQMQASRQGQLTRAGVDLYGVGRRGVEQAHAAEQQILDRAAQMFEGEKGRRNALNVASIYARAQKDSRDKDHDNALIGATINEIGISQRMIDEINERAVLAQASGDSKIAGETDMQIRQYHQQRVYRLQRELDGFRRTGRWTDQHERDAASAGVTAPAAAPPTGAAGGALSAPTNAPHIRPDAAQVRDYQVGRTGRFYDDQNRPGYPIDEPRAGPDQ